MCQPSLQVFLASVIWALLHNPPKEATTEELLGESKIHFGSSCKQAGFKPNHGSPSNQFMFPFLPVDRSSGRVRDIHVYPSYYSGGCNFPVLDRRNLCPYR